MVRSRPQAKSRGQAHDRRPVTMPPGPRLRRAREQAAKARRQAGRQPPPGAMAGDRATVAGAIGARWRRPRPSHQSPLLPRRTPRPRTPPQKKRPTPRCPIESKSPRRPSGSRPPRPARPSSAATGSRRSKAQAEPIAKLNKLSETVDSPPRPDDRRCRNRPAGYGPVTRRRRPPPEAGRTPAGGRRLALRDVGNGGALIGAAAVSTRSCRRSRPARPARRHPQADW